jgi:hypothetical protein
MVVRVDGAIGRSNSIVRAALLAPAVTVRDSQIHRGSALNGPVLAMGERPNTVSIHRGDIVIRTSEGPIRADPEVPASNQDRRLTVDRAKGQRDQIRGLGA